MCHYHYHCLDVAAKRLLAVVANISTIRRRRQVFLNKVSRVVMGYQQICKILTMFNPFTGDFTVTVSDIKGLHFLFFYV